LEGAKPALREGRIALLVEHVNNPRHRGVLRDADVVMPGGSPECGGSVVVYLKGDGNGKVEGLSWRGEGDTISMGATSIAMERIVEGHLTMEEVLRIDCDEFVQELGKDLIGSRTRNATLGLSTIKAAIRQYSKGKLANTAEPTPA